MTMAIKRCKMSFAVQVGGAPRVVPAGTLVEDGDPILQGREAYFEDVETYVSDREASRVEQATAAPGEQRTVRPVARKAPAKKAVAKKPVPSTPASGETKGGKS